MSVILECQPGDDFFCIQSFYGCPEGEPFSWDKARHFQVGERLRFVNSYLSSHYKEHPSGWMVRFEAADGNRYTATQTYFATSECWEGLQKYFARPRRKTLPAKRARQKTPARTPGRKKDSITSSDKKRRSA